jgi:hypothetical protein
MAGPSRNEIARIIAYVERQGFLSVGRAAGDGEYTAFWLRVEVDR